MDYGPKANRFRVQIISASAPAKAKKRTSEISSKVVDFGVVAETAMKTRAPKRRDAPTPIQDATLEEARENLTSALACEIFALSALF